MIDQYLKKWKLACFWPYTPLQDKSMETGHIHQGLTGIIDAQVPGSVYMDLLKAGLIEDPYFDMNSLKCEWVKDRWWVYNTSFTLDNRLKNKQIKIVFMGIDYKAHIFLNNTKIGEHVGMYTHCKIDISKQVLFDNQDNHLKVVIEHAPDEMGQIGYTSRTFTQKARFTYKWDFGTRMVSLGLYDDVYIEVTGNASIESSHIRYIDNTVNYEAKIKGRGLLKTELSYDGKIIATAEKSVISENINLTMPVPSPKLWYPNGYGEQPLYDLKIMLFEDNIISDEKSFKVGLRTLSYECCDNAAEGSLPYIPVINGRRIYIKGVNCTPLDHMYGCVGYEQYEKLILLAKAANVNLIRVWGGGLIEKEVFYDLCDKHGIMVWQEFIQSSSGIENEPSALPEFLELAAKTAETAVKEKRNHVSLTYWCGGNELFYEDGTPCSFEHENLSMLKEITNRLDPDRLMLPASPSGPVGGFNYEHPTWNHDIHGPWKFEGGVKGYYNRYNISTVQLHSEFGVDGLANFDSISKFLSPINRNIYNMNNNMVWRHHGEWWDTYGDRDYPLFGEMSSLKQFVKLSQFMQAEGIRYALESNRRRAFENCGSIVWQFNEPWPNISCTNLVDYYMKPKLAYYFFRDAMKPLHISMRYNQLAYKPKEMFYGSVYIHDDNNMGFDKITVKILDDNKKVIKKYDTDKNFEFEWCIDGIEGTFYIECAVESGDYIDKNLYMYFIIDDNHPHADKSAVERYYDDYLISE